MLAGKTLDHYNFAGFFKDIVLQSRSQFALAVVRRVGGMYESQ
jgi:hypothetical protein